MSFEKKEKKLGDVIFGVLSGIGLYTFVGFIAILLARYISFVYNYFIAVFLVLYVLLFVLTFILVKQKFFRWSYLASSLFFLIVYVITAF